MVIVAVVARRINTAPSILLVIAGIVLALIPGVPRITLAPELVLLGILPPLIYSAGVAMSWREFRFNLRPITLLAVGCVVFTTCAVAAVAHWLLGMPLAVGFVLGAIVSPPDAVAPLSIVRRLGVPRRLVVVLEGEGLANDATALILYRFAVAAVGSGVFSLTQAAGEFALIVVGEIAYGIGLGWLSLRLRRWARDPRVEITLSLLMPYVAFLLPAHLGGSGVLATIAAGLFVSWNGPLLIPAATRLQGIFFWDLLIYLLEGLVFLVTGLQIRTVFDRLDPISLRGPLLAVLLTVAIVIAARFVWVFPAAYLPRRLSRKLARRDPAPPWRQVFFLAFVGVRGVVTLIGQGLMLPGVVRWLGLGSHAAEERQRERAAELSARAEALNVVQNRLDRLAAEGRIAPEVLAILRARHHDRVGRLPRSPSDGFETASVVAELRSDLIAAERAFIYRLLREGKITDEARRRIERELDLEEAAIACKKEGGVEPPL